MYYGIIYDPHSYPFKVKFGDLLETVGLVSLGNIAILYHG